jgi:hypothetical protein
MYRDGTINQDQRGDIIDKNCTGRLSTLKRLYLCTVAPPLGGGCPNLLIPVPKFFSRKDISAVLHRCGSSHFFADPDPVFQFVWIRSLRNKVYMLSFIIPLPVVSLYFHIVSVVFVMSSEKF